MLEIIRRSEYPSSHNCESNPEGTVLTWACQLLHCPSSLKLHVYIYIYRKYRARPLLAGCGCLSDNMKAIGCIDESLSRMLRFQSSILGGNIVMAFFFSWVSWVELKRPDPFRSWQNSIGKDSLAKVIKSNWYLFGNINKNFHVWDLLPVVEYTNPEIGLPMLLLLSLYRTGHIMSRSVPIILNVKYTFRSKIYNICCHLFRSGRGLEFYKKWKT